MFIFRLCSHTPFLKYRVMSSDFSFIIFYFALFSFWFSIGVVLIKVSHETKIWSRYILFRFIFHCEIINFSLFWITWEIVNYVSLKVTWIYIDFIINLNVIVLSGHFIERNIFYCSTHCKFYLLLWIYPWTN